MPNANRQRGDYLERQTKAALVAHDWWVVRAAGSLGEADIVALRDRSAPLLISCKTNGSMTPRERQALVDAAHRAGARPIVAYRQRRGWIDFGVVDAAGVRPFGEPMKVPKRAARAPDDDDEGSDR